VRNAAENVRKQVRSKIDSVVSTTRRTVDTFRSTVSRTASRIRQSASSVATRVRTTASDFRSSAGDALQHSKKAITRAATNIKGSIVDGFTRARTTASTNLRRASTGVNGTSGSHGDGHTDGWQSWAGNSESAVQSDGDGDDPVLEPVPGFFSDPMGYITANIINSGRKSDAAKEILEDSLVPAADWLQSIPDPEAHPILSEIHNNVPEEGAALLAGALVTPMQGDEAVVAVGLGLLVIGSLTINYFSGKNWQPPGARLPRQPLPQKEVLERTLPGSPPGPPWNPDPNKQPEDIPPDEIANLKGIGKVIFIISSLAVVAKSLILGETEPGDPDYPLPTAQPDPTATNTPTSTPTVTPTDTPTATPSPTGTPSPTPTNTSTYTPTPTPTPSHTGVEDEVEVATSDSN
jgi:hypothetical protein